MDEQQVAGELNPDLPGVPPSPQLDRNTAAAAGGGEAPDPVAAPPANADMADEYAVACSMGKPKVAMVGKYTDRVPVQLKNRAHLESLMREHGDAAVEVLS